MFFFAEDLPPLSSLDIDITLLVEGINLNNYEFLCAF